jgi:radical SAM superfamily enzyme YgiQ (UPF0313 family)
MKNIYLFQPQYAVEFRKEVNYWLPYSAACVWAYASQYQDIVDNFILKDLIFKRQLIDPVLDRMENPSLCGFSCYMWNEQYCLEMARRVKEQWPNCIIAFGGAQTSAKMLKHKFIDCIMLAEGEESFLRLLRNILNNTVPDVIYPQARLADLNIPSPYMLGIFDKIIEENPNAVWAMTLETNRGCPYACTFCDWGGTTYSKIKQFGLDRVAADLDWARTHNVAYLVIADANFGIFKERDLVIAQMVRDAADGSHIDTINIQYAKNSTETVFEIAKIIGPYGRGITVSVQSMNELTLNTIKRKNLDINNIRELMQLSQKHSVGTYTEVILGLPDETKDTWIDGLNQLLELGQHQSIECWLAQLIENSEMATDLSRKKHGIKSIKVKGFMNLGQSDDVDNIDEYTELVNATRDLTTEDMVECYMYTWMIIQWHIAGYTQIIARYNRNVEGIPYRKFYDKLYAAIQTAPSFQKHFELLKSIVEEYLTNGNLLADSIGGHALHTFSYKFMFDNKKEAINLALATLKTMCNEPDNLHLLQDSFIINFNQQYPCTITTGFNLDTGEITPTQYIFTSRRVDKKIQDFYTLRRDGLIKNSLTIL